MGFEWKDSLKGAGKGAMAGSIGGPMGMLIGALAGGSLGGFGDDLDKRITGDSQNNVTDQMLSLASMAGGIGAMGGASGGASGFGSLMGSGGMDPRSFDWSNILKMLGSAGTTGSGSEQQQPTMGGMIPRMPVPLAPVMTSAPRDDGYYQTWLRQNNLS